MAENVFKKCKFPNDLLFAAKKLESELATRIESNQVLFQETQAISEGMDVLLDEGFSILEELFTKSGSSLKSTADVAETYGLLPNNSTTDQDEQFVTNAGILLFDTVGYMPGQNFDISKLRRMYFSYGLDLKKTKETMVNTTDKAVFINDRLVLTVIPPKEKGRNYTLAEIKKLLKLDYLTKEDIVVTDDQSTIVMTTSFIAENKSQSQIVNVLKVPAYDLITNVFHFGDIDSSVTAIERYTDLGYSGDSLGAILEGQDLANYNADTVVNMINSEKQVAYDLISKIDYVLLGYNEFSKKTSQSYKKLLVDSMAAMEKSHRKAISTSIFQVSTFVTKEIYTLLSKKHSDERIEYLLKHRKDITDFYFNPTDEELLKLLRKVVSAAPTGSTYISNRAVNYIENNPLPKSDMLFLYSCIFDAIRVLNFQKTEDLPNPYYLKKMREYLTNFVDHPFPSVSEKEQKTGMIIDGVPSAATPAGVITANMDPKPTFDYEDKKKAVENAFKELLPLYPKELAGPLADIINAVVRLFDQAMAAINQFMKQAQNTIFAMKKKLDAFISQHLSLTGGGVFQNSLLKCAINWDIGLSTDLLEMLSNFLLKFVGQVVAFLAKLKAWIADILEKVLCLPVDLINNFLGQIEMILPNVCKLPRVSLGDQLTEALTKMKNVSQFYNVCLGALGSDIAKLRMEVWSAPDKLASFQSGAGCQSEAGAGFMTASTLNLGVGVGV
jgi:hypothetical protein